MLVRFLEIILVFFVLFPNILIGQQDVQNKQYVNINMESITFDSLNNFYLEKRYLMDFIDIVGSYSKLNKNEFLLNSFIKCPDTSSSVFEFRRKEIHQGNFTRIMLNISDNSECSIGLYGFMISGLDYKFYAPSNNNIEIRIVEDVDQKVYEKDGRYFIHSPSPFVFDTIFIFNLGLEVYKHKVSNVNANTFFIRIWDKYKSPVETCIKNEIWTLKDSVLYNSEGQEYRLVSNGLH